MKTQLALTAFVTALTVLATPFAFADLKCTASVRDGANQEPREIGTIEYSKNKADRLVVIRGESLQTEDAADLLRKVIIDPKAYVGAHMISAQVSDDGSISLVFVEKLSSVGRNFRKGVEQFDFVAAISPIKSTGAMLITKKYVFQCFDFPGAQ